MKMSRLLVVCVTLVLVVGAAASAQDQKKGGRGGGFRFGRGGLGQSLVGLAAQESVQKDIGLSADVVTKVTALNEEYGASRTKEMQALGNLQDIPQAERGTKLAAVTTKLNAEYTPKLQTVVGADAVKRLKQIQIQSQGGGALANADVASELKLNDEQKKKIDDLSTEYTTKSRELFTGGGDRQELAAKTAELTKDRDTKALAVLTAEQKEKFTALKGKTFDISTLSFGGGGRRGKNNN